MKTLTICQPYAHLICITKTKRVENRTWPTRHRGPLLIHAGKSRAWLPETIGEDGKFAKIDRDSTTGDPFVFGSIIGIAQLVGCLHIDDVRRGTYTHIYPWLREHAHTTGPWCWVLTDCRALPEPIPYRGAQGLFEVQDSIVAAPVRALMESAA